AGIQHIVAPGAGADTRPIEPTIDTAKSFPPEQPAAKCIARFGLFRRQGHAAIQAQEYQLGMNLAYVDGGMRAHECVNFHDLASDMPELAGNARLAAPQRLPVRGVRIGEFLPEPAPRAGEDARGVRPQLFARDAVTGAMTIAGHADRDIDPGAVERTGQRIGDIA